MSKVANRRKLLLRILGDRDAILVEEASAELGVSDSTVRRLFADLEAEGRIIRTHGGARLTRVSTSSYSYRQAAAEHAEAKKQIGVAAAGTVKNGERIFLDSGTTVLRLAEALTVRFQTGELDRLTVVTNSLVIHERLAGNVEVILLGGRVRLERCDVSGPAAERAVGIYHFDRAFFGADAISVKGGFMTTDESTSRINELVIENSERFYVLAAPEKFSRNSFTTYASIDAASGIYTSPRISGKLLRQYRTAGAKIFDK